MNIQRTLDNNNNPIWTLSTPTLVLTLSPTDLLILDGLLQQQEAQLQLDAGVATAPSPVVTPPITTGGIIVFSGDNSATGSTNPTVVGKHLNYPASWMNPAEGTYTFDQIDTDMKPWIDQGKQCMLRVSWSGWNGWVTPKTPSWTPDWVYAKGVKSITASDGSKKPQYWNTAYLAALTEFATALAAKYDGDPNVLCVVVPCGDGSETKVDTKKDSNVVKRWQAIGYTDAIWWDTIQKIITIYRTAFKQTPLMLLPNASFIGGTKTLSEQTVLDYAVGLNPPLWLQEDGLVPGEVLKGTAWSKTTLLMEQRNASTSVTELEKDFQAAIANKAKYVLIFSQNFTTANASTLQKYAALLNQ